jgi:hypothetical protein
MKKTLMIFGCVLLFLGCQQDVMHQEDSSIEMESDILGKNGNQNKVWICHRTGNGSYNLILVSSNAVNAHLNHGDLIGVVYNQDFESNTDNWNDSNSGWYGTVTRVASGTNGINSLSGGWHAQFEGDASSAPFSPFDGYNATWPGTYRAEISIYLDPSWGTSQGFDYSVASSRTNDTHLRDFIFHVNKDASTAKLLVGGSNNTNFTPRENLENGNHYEVTSAGWYTFQHVFYDNNGSLAVDLNLLDSNGTIVFTETRNNANDLIDGIVGGNRYAWFTFINVEGGIAVDNHGIYRGCAY